MKANIDILLMDSCWEGNMEKAKQLISDGANPNYQDGRGVTPLMLASASGNIDLLKYLIDMGADVELGDFEKGWTASSYAALNGQHEVSQFFRNLKSHN